ncbi:MAG: hypothetical protein H6574_06360 [Lewinellaceae bacterium]|nr:hypothetical protein [Lewinellaceae bacterium]
MRLTLIFNFLFAAISATAQMWNGADTLYGNEWIDFSKTYFKIRVADDGVYRLSGQTMADAGFPVATVSASQFRLYRYGVQEPVFTTTDGLFAPQDYLEFFGEKNRDALDRHLFENPDADNLNPWFSLFNDTATYYLTWETSGQALRYTAAPNDLSNLPPKEPFCWSETGFAYSNARFKRQISNEIQYSWFDGEGYGSHAASDFTANIAPKQIFSNGPPAQLSLRYACGTDQHQQRLTFNDSLLTEDQFFNWRVFQHQFDIPAASLLATNKVRLQSSLGSNDRHSIAGIFLRYPRLFNFENGTTAEFWLDSGSDARYLEIQAFNVSGGAPLLLDRTNLLRLEATVEAGLVKVLLPPATGTRRLWLANPVSGIRQVTTLQALQFRDYRTEAADYIILSNPALFSDPTNGGADHVAAYADYRRSPQGGGYNVAVVDINELYEQFAYGVRYHPMAVRNFVQFVHKNWPSPRFLLLIGKGLDYDRFRRPDVQSQLADSLFFVPTYGSPGADQLLTMRDKKLSEPLFPVGRLAVTRASDIRVYLDKVIEHEQQFSNAPQTLTGKAWMKRVIHNSGGLAGETAGIRAYTQSMADELATNRVGADVHNFYKTSNDPIQLSSYEQMLDLLNGGVSIWMIFGHSSSSAVDFDIGAPAAYDNKGRYPLMMIMGCFSGQCSNLQQGIGEQFVLAPERGAIAYFASVNFSFSDALHAFGKKYYERLGGADYGATIGEVLVNTVRDLSGSGYPAQIAQLHQNLLQGDPALRLHFYPGPDYVVDGQSVSISPNPVSLEQPKLQMQFDVVNIGENTGGDLPLQLDQRRPDDVLLSRLQDTIPAPAFRRSLTYDLSTSGSQLGFNRFLVTLDPENVLAEQPAAAEFNNELIDGSGQAGVPVYFFAEDVAPVFPENYGIVQAATPVLRASTLNTNATAQRYLFELDTLETFNSPFKKSGELFQKGGLLEWQPNAALNGGTVYYWRVARDSLVNGQVPWRQRSFVYLPGSAPGWNQSHFGQFAEGDFINLEAVDSTRHLEFVNSAGFISINVAYRNRDRYPGMQNVYYEGFFGDAGFNSQGLTRGVAVMVQDPNTGHIVPNPPNSKYNSHPTKTKALFSFNTQDSLERIALMEFLEQDIPAGSIVGLLALHPWNDTLGYAPRRWALDSVSFGRNLFQVLENQGATQVRTLVDYTQGPHPYGLIFQKDNPAYGATDTVVYHIDSVLNIRRNFQAKWSVGQFETPPIGPVKSWQRLVWQPGFSDDPSDQVSLAVLGVREGLSDTLLFSTSTATDTSIAQVQAGLFPHLRLRYESSDTAARTATQPAFLRVLYEPLPEGALNPRLHAGFYTDTLQQGEPGSVSFAFSNISAAPFDSLLVRFRIENETNAGQDYFRRFRNLPVGDSLHTAFQFETKNLIGNHRLIVDVNPANDQAELHHFNNTALQAFYVARDIRNPLLDVTFDGLHILDGDLVSPQPVVIMTLTDENRFLAVQDTSAFALRLQYPDGTIRSVAHSDPTVLFVPADPAKLPEKNRARLEWRPVFTDDGLYRLLVNGRDATGNISGSIDYAVNFQVITRSSISNLLNYPNPFSTSTCFVYTLTGAETPTHFRLQIMTVSGRVVREITEAEFGPMQAGTHTSSFCWDGRDQFGDQLANGVYLYRALAKKADGSDFEFFANEATDGYFKGGFGKMVLMR